MNFNRRCAICESPLNGRKGHGFVTSSGVICGNIKYHQRLRRKQKRRELLDKEVEDMLFFEVEVSKNDDQLLVESEGETGFDFVDTTI